MPMHVWLKARAGKRGSHAFRSSNVVATTSVVGERSSTRGCNATRGSLQALLAQRNISQAIKGAIFVSLTYPLNF